jgi:hypothetical protein
VSPQRGDRSRGGGIDASRLYAMLAAASRARSLPPEQRAAAEKVMTEWLPLPLCMLRLAVITEILLAVANAVIAAIVLVALIAGSATFAATAGITAILFGAATIMFTKFLRRLTAKIRGYVSWAHRLVCSHAKVFPECAECSRDSANVAASLAGKPTITRFLLRSGAEYYVQKDGKP